MLDFAVLTAQEVDARGNQSIGWLAGLYTIGLFIAVGLLLWSFTKMAKKAREPWEGEDADGEGDRDQPPQA